MNNLKKAESMLEFNESDFTSTEMNELVIKMINERINHQKIQFLKNWESNHSISRKPFAEKIAELEGKKNYVSSIIAQATEKKVKVIVQDTLQFKLVG